MSKKITSSLSIILPNKKVNLFVLFLIILGIISGSIFLVILSESDKSLVTNQISNFMINVDANKINHVQAFKNALFQNMIFIALVWILGMSIIGVIFNVALVYFKGFTIGFGLSSLFLTYKYKGFLAGLIYMVPTYLINILITLIIGSYSIVFTMKLWKQIFSKDKINNLQRPLKKYFLALGITIVLAVISSIAEAYLIPSFLKLIIKLFI